MPIIYEVRDAEKPGLPLGGYEEEEPATAHAREVCALMNFKDKLVQVVEVDTTAGFTPQPLIRFTCRG
jgi:hypothetical protein